MRLRAFAVALLLLLTSCEPPPSGSGQGTAPSVQLLQPNGGENLIGSAEIAWIASDPDQGDTVTIDLQLVEVGKGGSETLAATIATGLPSAPSSYTWDISSVPASRGGQPIWYRIRALAHDAGNLNVRTDESDASFTIDAAPVTTSYTWADVQPVFLNRCASCHGEPARMGAPESFRLDKYDASDPVAPMNSDLGVYEMRARVYDRLVIQTTMPPAYAPQPSAAESGMIANWIEGGAPRG